MTKIATGYVALKADDEDFKRDLKSNRRNFEQTTTQMQNSANRAAASIKKMWIGAAAGVAIVSTAAMKAVKAASALEEATNKFNVVFKGQQKLAESWAKTLVSSYAMSTREAKENLAAMQDLLVPMGMAADAAGKMSFEVVKLAADLGSFNNMPTERVMADIQSALVGNYETMKKYGVVLKASIVQQAALNMGLAKTKDELTAAHMVQAAYKLILEGSQAAIGDMARSVGSYALATKEARAAWEDFKAELGKALLPMVTPALNWMTDWLKDFQYVINEIKKAWEKIERILRRLGLAEPVHEIRAPIPAPPKKEGGGGPQKSAQAAVDTARQDNGE